MVFTKYSGLGLLFVLLLLIGPVLAKQESTNNEDKYILKDEWKNKHKVKEQYGELTHVVFMLADIGDPDHDGSRDGYELAGYNWFPASAPLKYTINPSTPVTKFGLTQAAVVQSVTNSFEVWDSVNGIYNYPTIDSSGKASLSSPDYKNVFTWGALSDNNVIALSNIWYYTSSKQIIDVDIVFNSYYKWGIDKDGEGPTYGLPVLTFDIQNIGTHEVGHFLGLDDIYVTSYSAMTMYGYASYGEVKKRSLEPGDTMGLNRIYSKYF